jgi:hypothetical protein
MKHARLGGPAARSRGLRRLPVALLLVLGMTMATSAISPAAAEPDPTEPPVEAGPTTTAPPEVDPAGAPPTTVAVEDPAPPEDQEPVGDPAPAPAPAEPTPPANLPSTRSSAAPLGRGADVNADAGRAAAAVVPGAITFSEHPLNTAITDQYQDRGFVFGGDNPFITTDRSTPNSPVLSGSPLFVGQIEIRVVDPATGDPATASGLDLDVGYIDNRNSVEVAYFGLSGGRIGAVRANAFGINTIHLPVRGIHRVVVRATESEPAGFAIDNVAKGTIATTVVPHRSIALGDSYTSGEGLGTYDCGTDLHRGTYFKNTSVLVAGGTSSSARCDTSTGQPLHGLGYLFRGFADYENLCHRSGAAWPNQVRQRLGIAAGDSLFVACSGAVTKNIGLLSDGNVAQYPRSPSRVAGGQIQITNARDFVRNDHPVDFVTIGIGGNDAGFGDVVKTCLRKACMETNGFTTSQIGRVDTVVYPRLVRTFTQLREEFGDAVILTYGYPTVVDPDLPACASLRGPWGVYDLEAEERRWASEVFIPRLNEAIADAAAETGITYMPIDEVTRGHELCSTDPWVNGLTGGDDILGLVGNESFHPRRAAHDAITRYFMDHYTDGHGGLTFTNPAPNPNIRPVSQPITLTLGHIGATPQGQCGTDCVQPACTPTDCRLHLEMQNFSPQAQLEVTLHSDPVDLGTATTDAAGNATIDVTVPSEVEDGYHTLEVTGEAPDGRSQLAVEPVQIKRVEPTPPTCDDPERGCDTPPTTTPSGHTPAPPTSPTTTPSASGHLPRTGREIATVLRLACMLLAAGVAALLTARLLRRTRRRRRSLRTVDPTTR